MLVLPPSCGEFRSRDGCVSPVNAGNFAVFAENLRGPHGLFFSS